MDVVISKHALFELARRQISEALVRNTAQNPQQVTELAEARTICQSKYYDPVEEKEMLLRVIYEKRYDTIYIITAYKTSKIDKYWETGS